MSKIKLLVVLLFLLGYLLSYVGTKNSKKNLMALEILNTSHSVLLHSPWADPDWWGSMCDENKIALNRTIPSSMYVDSPHLIAVYYLAHNDCDEALMILGDISQHPSTSSVNRILKAYTLSMLGRWKDATEAYPIDQIPAGNWEERKYWGNVLIRAGLNDDNHSLVSNLHLLQNGEYLLGYYPIATSLELAEFLHAEQRQKEALHEMHYVIILQDEEESAWLLKEAYDQILADYLSECSSQFAPTICTHKEIQTHQYHEIGLVWDNNWTLVSFELANRDVALSPFIELKLQWQFTDGSKEELIEVSTLVRNMIPDAGFEFLPSMEGIRPPLYIGGLYNEVAPYPYVISTENENNYLCLGKSSNQTSSGVMTAWRPVNESNNNRPLIQGGMFQTQEGGQAYIGWRWRSTDTYEFEHIVTGQNSLSWKQKALVVNLPVEAEEVSFHLLNYQTTGASCFDNLFAFYVPDPPHNYIR